MTEFPAQIRNYLRNHTWMVYLPGLFNAMDLADVAALHAPGALLVQQCKQDALLPLRDAGRSLCVARKVVIASRS
ncbi:MAG: hypothetical protein FJW31_04500 [Acidobacteria bacterium]|nr:hypothetical protein [Acidobacteriota bacterium]